MAAPFVLGAPLISAWNNVIVGGTLSLLTGHNYSCEREQGYSWFVVHLSRADAVRSSVAQCVPLFDVVLTYPAKTVRMVGAVVALLLDTYQWLLSVLAIPFLTRVHAPDQCSDLAGLSWSQYRYYRDKEANMSNLFQLLSEEMMLLVVTY